MKEEQREADERAIDDIIFVSRRAVDKEDMVPFWVEIQKKLTMDVKIYGLS